MLDRDKTSPRSNFRKFFLRGLAIVLPSVLTIWLLFVAYNFVQEKIAEPINRGVRWLVLTSTPWPPAPIEVAVLADPVNVQQRRHWSAELEAEGRAGWEAAGFKAEWLQRYYRKARLRAWWKKYALGMDLIGLAIAVALIYSAGASLGSIIGRRLYHRGEELLGRVPLIRQVYPSVKQVTDFLVGDGKEKLKFSRVVAVEYPRKGLWSVGLVTGDTMRDIAARAPEPCVTVFVPSSPTPFTGYVITIPRSETIDLPITIEQALRFTISGGVIIPPGQQVASPGPGERAAAGPGLTTAPRRAPAM